jgi:membrane protein implicated in regulation of membrane protease activity
MESFDIGKFLQNLTFWHWLITGFGFVILEMIMPGVVFLWVGVAAAITGLIMVVQPEMPWEMQMLIFAALSIISTVSGRVWIRNSPTETDQPHLNQRGRQYIGRQFVLDEAIENGTGSIKVDDSNWRITGDDAAEGAKIEVTGVDGVVLKVKNIL